MLTQGPTPDPKCELNITFFMLTHPLHCLICAKDIMIIAFFLQVMGEWQGWVGGSFMLGVGWWTVGGYHIFSIFSVFLLLLIVLSWLVHDNLLCLLNSSIFAFFVSRLFN